MIDSLCLIQDPLLFIVIFARKVWEKPKEIHSG
jgi:hypothetical protein